jgi:hypothetical protein
MSNHGRSSSVPGTNPTLSRRMLFRSAVAMIGGVAAFLGTNVPAVAKMAQKAAGYQDTPKGDQSCATCALFKAPATCTLVDGDVAPVGWCRFFAKKTSSGE